MVALENESYGRAGDHLIRSHTQPVVEFVAGDGRTVAFQHPIGTTPRSYRIGEEVTVLFDPADPESARIRTRGHAVTIPAAMPAFGVALACSGVAIIVLAPWTSTATAAAARARRGSAAPRLAAIVGVPAMTPVTPGRRWGGGVGERCDRGRR